MNQEQLSAIGHALYQTQYVKEMKRYLVFQGRVYLHKTQMEEFFAFLESNAIRKNLLAGNPSFVEQVTRSFFYKDSTWEERIALVRKHIALMEETFSKDTLDSLYVRHEFLPIWQEDYEGQPIALGLWFHAGQRKEGCLSLTLRVGEIDYYQIMFWLGKGLKDEQKSLWIGALQGYPKGGEVVKALTKRYYGYRTKNLIFWGLRCIAEFLECRQIYAVTNEGYYAMNHLRVDRKLKTDFAEFWRELEGVPTEDKRFYIIPVAEYRKDMSEMKPSKRATHRKRFAFMDAVREEIRDSMQKMSGKA